MEFVSPATTITHTGGPNDNPSQGVSTTLTFSGTVPVVRWNGPSEPVDAQVEITMKVYAVEPQFKHAARESLYRVLIEEVEA